MTKAIFFLPLLLVGCASFQQTHDSKLTSSARGEMIDHQAQMKKNRADRDQESRDRSLVLKKQNLLGPSGLEPQTMQKLPMSSASHGRTLEIVPDSIISGKFSKVSEGQLYAEIIDRYQARDLLGFEMRSKAYLARFSNGDRRDEIYYLRGVSALSEKNYGEALANLNHVLRDHPNGKKAPAAMFAKGMAFRRMNLSREAKLALTEVLHRYPGSPESLRAKAELKIIK